jgi:hypothetical protein
MRRHTLLMTVTVTVKMFNPVVKAEREALTERVLAHFQDQLPALKLLCFLDDEDCSEFKTLIGRANRGLFSPIKNGRLYPDQMYWPMYVWESLLMNLPKKEPAIELKVYQLPFEQEARIVSKRVAENLCGNERVEQYIDTKASEALAANDSNDACDWQFVRQLALSSSYDLASQTQQFFQQMKIYAPQLYQLLQEMKHDPDFGSLDLRSFGI